MIYSIVISPIAEDELIESAKWYNERKELLGKEFINEVNLTLTVIKSNPNQFKLVYKDFRMGLTKRFPFEIFYSIAEDKILIHHIFHASRNPNIWMK
ncbi:MAG: type II toxin-antitoxin system RelE/ParE family toxin [Bacteroidota bacterium]